MLTTGWMYMLECSDGTFYTGSTNNLTLRLHQHQVGEGANYTKKRLPVKLVYSEEFERIDDAFYREKQVQGWNRKKKEALMRGDTELLKELSKSRAASLNSFLASEASPMSAMASASSLLSAMASTGSATADKTATAESAAMASASSPLSAMASAGSATADKTATADNAATSSRIPSPGASKAVAIAVAELAEAVKATNLLGDDTAESAAMVSEASPLSAMASTGSATADKTATADCAAMASASSPLSALASTGSATADKTATADSADTISRISITGESKAVAVVTELAEVVEATNLLGNATADKTSTPSTTKRLNN